MAQRIPISLLELNTFGHALCALFIYFMWWDKPFEVDCPTIIHDESVWGLRAATWMLDHRSPSVDNFRERFRAFIVSEGLISQDGEPDKARIIDDRHRLEIWSRTFGLPGECSLYEVVRKDKVVQDDISNGNELRQRVDEDGDERFESINLTLGRTVPGTGFKLELPPQPPSTSSDYWSEHPFPTINFSHSDLVRWRMAWNLSERDPGGRYYSDFFHELLVHRCGDWPDFRNISGDTSLQIGFIVATLTYGGLHMLAWSAHFRSQTEQLLWRISAAMVMGGLPVIFAALHLPNIIVFDYSHNFMDLIIRLTICVYVLARAYLVVECFIGLSNLPGGVYDVPTWSSYFPHVS